MQAKQTTENRYRGVSYTRPIDAAKEAVPVIDLADRLCGPGQMRRCGAEWRARCPLPDHEDRFPSFFANPGKNVWRCFGCSRGGDVVELYRLTHDFSEREAHVAAANLLHEFGHEVPQRPASRSRRWDRQRAARDAIDRERVEHIRMLVFRLVWVPWLRLLPEWTREEATESAWESSQKIARLVYEQRRAA